MSRPDYFDLFSQIQTKNSQIAQEDNESARNALISERDALVTQAYVFDVDPPMTDAEAALFGYIRLNTDTATFGTDIYGQEIYVGDGGDVLDYADFVDQTPPVFADTGGTPLYDKTGKPILDSNGVIVTKENMTFSVSDINNKLLSIS
jgi:hypothetical protein